VKIYPVFIPFSGCGQRCIYCQQNIITRTDTPDFDAIREGLRNFCRKNRDVEKEIAFFGGSFTLLPIAKQKDYFSLLGEFIPSIDGIRISTRPDGISGQVLSFCKENKVRTIELGIQSFSDSVLKKVGRPYTKEMAVTAAESIKSAGFRITIQLMPGLPGEDDNTLAETIAETVRIRPDFVRIYPTLVLKGTELEREYYEGRFVPLTLEKAIAISAEMTSNFEENSIKVIKTGLHSDVSSNQGDVVAGPYHPAFGEMVLGRVLADKILSLSGIEEPDYWQKNTLLISPKNISALKSAKNYLSIKQLPVKLDCSIGRYEISVTADKPSLVI